MKTNKYLLLVTACLFLLTSCKDLKEVSCSGVKGFKMNKIDMTGINADVQLGIKNPNSVGFSIYRSKFDISYNGIYLGKAKSKRRVHVDPNSNKTYSFTLAGKFKDVSLQDIMKLANGGGKGTMEVKGNIRAGKFFIYKKFPVDVKERVSLQ